MKMSTTPPQSIFRTSTPQNMPTTDSDENKLSVGKVSQESSILYTRKRAPKISVVPVLTSLKSQNFKRDSSMTPQIQSLKGKQSMIEKQQSRVKL